MAASEDLNTLRAVIGLEWRYWHRLLPGAFLLGWTAWLLPWVLGVEGPRGEELRQVALLTAAGLLGLVTFGALAMGLVRELIEGRLTFFLSRPGSIRGFWIGKTLAALGLLALVLGLALMPALVMGWDLESLVADWSLVMEDGAAVPLLAPAEGSVIGFEVSRTAAWPWASWLLGLPAVVLVLMLVVHWLRLAFAGRTAWLLVDVVLGVAFGSLVWTLRDGLVSMQAFAGMVWVERLWIIALPPLLWWAGLRRLQMGRVDLELSHRKFSQSAWAGIGLLCVLTVGYVGRLSSGDSDDLRTLIGVVMSPTGEHLALAGAMRHRAGRFGTFVVDLEPSESDADRSANKSREADEVAVAGLVTHLRFSADGERVVWRKCRRLVDMDCEIWQQNLAVTGSEPQATGIQANRWDAALDLSVDGERLAVGHRRGVEVYELDGGRLIASTGVVSALRLELLSSSRLRIVSFEDSDEPSQELGIFDLATRKYRRTGSLPVDVWGRGYAQTSDGNYLLFDPLWPRELQVRHAQTGELISDLTRRLQLSKGQTLVSSTFLDDDRLVLAIVDASRDDLTGRRGPRPRKPMSYRVVILDREVWSAADGASLLPEASSSGPSGVQHVKLDGLLELRLGPELVAGNVTLLMRRPNGGAVDPTLESLGLDPLAGWTTELVAPGASSTRMWSRGYVPRPLPQAKMFRPQWTPQGTVFIAGSQALFTLESESWALGSDESRPGRVVFDGFESPSDGLSPLDLAY